jgi:hypothetical protein
VKLLPEAGIKGVEAMPWRRKVEVQLSDVTIDELPPLQSVPTFFSAKEMQVS